jgi:hypothetical protein
VSGSGNDKIRRFWMAPSRISMARTMVLCASHAWGPASTGRGYEKG